MRRYASCMLACLVVGLGGCGTGGGGDNSDNTCDPAAPDCAEGLVCGALADGTGICTAPVTVRGMVVELATGEPVGGALVQAVDVNGSAVGPVAVTDQSGAYSIEVSVTRDAEGVPIDGEFTLRVQAQGYQQFPTAIRPALPIDATTAAMGEDESGFVVENALTTVALINLPGNVSILGKIVGSVEGEAGAGALVVAESGEAALTGFTDGTGQYTIVNLPAGTYTLTVYATGAAHSSISVTVGEGEEIVADAIAPSDAEVSTVSGSVQIVNAPGGLLTSVVLAVESTFEEAAGRGVVPPGLRVGDVEGGWMIEGVPPGDYVVLAAFENDDLVRDPDQAIAGTGTVRITVPDPDQGTAVSISEGFKITEALAVISPGADGPEQVDTLTPTFEWADDSSEDGYIVNVFDAFGQLVMSDEIGGVTGSETVTYPYDGPALEAGTFYQFRVTSFRDRQSGRTNISTTEDLRGVFYFVEESADAPE